MALERITQPDEGDTQHQPEGYFEDYVPHVDLVDDQQLAELLAERGADSTVVTSDGFTPLFAAAIHGHGAVAVPLILVVLGGNLARNTIPKNQPGDITDPKEEKRLLYASLLARMVFPTIVMAPFLALVAKYVPVSIVDDKIFIVVAFLLTGAPSALQLSAITQTNNVYPTVMSNILFQSYVVWILPSTLILVRSG